MELDELHVLQRQSRAQHHGVAIPGARMSGSAGEVRTAVAARGENAHVRAEAMQLAFRQIERDDTATGAVLHDEVDHEVFDEEGRTVADRLLIQRMQHRMPGAIRRGAGALRDALAKVRRHATEGTLVDAPLGGARKRQAIVLKFDDCGGGLLAHELDRILIAEPVRAFDRVIHVPAPVILAHVAEGGADSALGRHRVAARRKELGDTRRRKSRLRKPEGGAQPRTSRADHDDVVAVVDPVVTAHTRPPRATCSTAKTAAAAARTCAKFEITRAKVLRPSACT